MATLSVMTRPSASLSTGICPSEFMLAERGRLVLAFDDVDLDPRQIDPPSSAMNILTR